jgi:hypothetical protein
MMNAVSLMRAMCMPLLSRVVPPTAQSLAVAWSNLWPADDLPSL